MLFRSPLEDNENGDDGGAPFGPAPPGRPVPYQAPLPGPPPRNQGKGWMGLNDLSSVNNIMANISWEGGAKLIYYLLSATIQPLDGAGGDLPSISNV